MFPSHDRNGDIGAAVNFYETITETNSQGFDLSDLTNANGGSAYSEALDLLANQFYGDVTLYWIIAAANPNYVNFGSLSVAEGTQIRIPTDINDVLSKFYQLNNS